MNCREASEMILNGERNAALEEHLGQCSECRSLDEDLRRMTEFAEMPLPEVPEKLDKAVLACAASQKPQRSTKPALFFRMPVLRAAAAVAVLGACAALTFSAVTGGGTGSVPVRVSSGRPAVEAAGTNAADVLDYLEGAVELDADLLTLSVELDQTESDLQLMASASTPSWYPAGSYGDF